MSTPLQDTRIHRTPTVRQMEAVECGAASLAMVLAHHGRWVPLEALRLECGVTRDGSKASNVLRAARNHGMVARGFKREPAQLREMPLPMIVFWNFNHFVVLEGFRGGKAWLNDPADGRRQVSEAEFDQSFTGVALTFERGPQFEPGGERPSATAALARRFSGMSTALVFLILVGLGLVVPGMVIPSFTSAFVDNVLVGQLDGWFRPLVLGLVVVALLRMALTAIEARYLLRMETAIALAQASRFFWHVLRLPAAFYTQRSPGDIAERVQINDRVAMLLSGELARGVLSALTATLFLTIMLFYDVLLTLASVAVASLSVITMQLLARRTREMSQKLVIDMGKLAGASVNGLASIETLKATGAEADFFGRWSGYHAKYLNAEQGLTRLQAVIGLVAPTLVAINAAVVLGLGGLRVIDGAMSIGQLVAFQALVTAFVAPFMSLAQLGTTVQEVFGDMQRLDDVVQHPVDPEVSVARRTHESAGSASAPTKLEGRIELRAVNFGYSVTDPPLIRALDMRVEPGMRVALVGPSGCGKSTVSRLLTGLYSPWSGAILFDGKPRAEIGRYELTSSVALVDQDVVLFNGTIRDNLTLWDTGIPEEDIVRAARDACIHDVIVARRGGYDAPISEGGRDLSGGERQRLEIARALASNPRILVLDEATSALDVDTEKRIDDNLRRRGCTCVIIAHRLSTIRDADEIIVLDAGEAVERGTHEQLLAIENGRYRALVAEI
jgi:NHLM bacteriocin system ABC transporter peptidase/ATP-binding protein